MNQRWAIVAAAILLAAIVGGIAYNVGLHQGVAQSGKILAAPGGAYPYPYYGWHPWGFGFFFFPFFFFALFFLIIRGIFWRGRWYRRGYMHGCEDTADPDRR